MHRSQKFTFRDNVCPMPYSPFRASRLRRRHRKRNDALRIQQRQQDRNFGTMKRTIVLSLIVFATICLLSGSSGAQQRPAKDQRLPVEKKVLIVYLSRTNNTKAVAEIIHQRVGGRLVALELETPYPADYNTTVQ